MLVWCVSEGEILQHAELVAKDGTYLEDYDLWLYSCKRSIDLRLVKNLFNFEHMSTSGAIQFVEGIAQQSFPEKDRQVYENAQAKQTILLTSCDLSPSLDRQYLNHWVPCWSLESLGGDAAAILQSESERVAEKTKDNKDSLCQRMIRVGQELEGEDKEVFENMISRSIADEEEKLARYKNLLQRLQAEVSVVMQDVPGDGNCGIWSLLALQKEPPLGKKYKVNVCGTSEMSAMRAMRQELKEMWTSVANSDWWQKFFDTMAGPRRQMNAMMDGASTPKHDAPKRLSVFVYKFKNEISPPKLTQCARRCGRAGLVCPRPERGPAVPMSSEGRQRQCKAEAAHPYKDYKRILASGIGKEATDAKEPKDSKAEEVLKRERNDQEQSEELVNLNQLVEEPKTKKRRARRQNQHEKDLKVARNYLAECGIINGDFVKVHCQKALLRGAVECNVGGWVQLLTLLIKGEEPSDCPRCVKLLRSQTGFRSFSLTNLQQAVHDARDMSSAGDIADHDGCKESKPVDQEDKGAMPVGVKEEDKDENDGNEAATVADAADDADEDAGDETGPAEVHRLFRDNPCLSLLPEGTKNKRIPVQCSLCIRKSTGEKAAFDARLVF